VAMLFDPWGQPYFGPVGLWRRWWQEQADQLRADPAARLAVQHGFVVAPAALAKLGWRRADIRRELRRGNWASVGHGALSPLVLSPSGNAYRDRRRAHGLSAAATALRNPDGVAADCTAAILHGLPTMAVPPTPQLTARSDATLGRRAGSHTFGASVRPEDASDWFGVPVLTVARTLVDLARHSRRDGIMAIDAALREELVDPDDLKRAVSQAAGWPGIRQAREVLALGDGRAESAAESITRLALVDEGFPHFEPQVVVRDPARRRNWRVDLLEPVSRVIVEVDGLDKYRDDNVRKEEKIRETRLEKLGYCVIRVTWDDVVRHWVDTAALIRKKIRERAPHLPP